MKLKGKKEKRERSEGNFINLELNVPLNASASKLF